jgi:hypothetical protein
MTIKSAEYQVYNGSTYDKIHFKTDASLVNIEDTGNKITATNVEGAFTEVVDKIGVLTTDLADVSSKQGNLTALNTTDKTSLVKAINELFTSANNGKTAIASAVNAKGISATGADTFSVLATKIGTASLVNTADATVVASEMLSGKTGYKNGAKITGTMVSRAYGTLISNTWTSGAGDLSFAIPIGAYLQEGGFGGGVSCVSRIDANFISANMLSGKGSFGLAGSAPNITNSAGTPSGGYDGDYWIQP